MVGVGRERREWQRQGVRRGGEKGRGENEEDGVWVVGGLGYIRKVRVVESRRGAVAKESLTHLPPSWLRPPTPIPCTRPKPSPRRSLSAVFSRLRLTLERATHDCTSVPAACQVACLPACLRTKSSLTLQSLYIYGIPAAPPTLHLLLHLLLLVLPRGTNSPY